jgi:septum formation protein
MLSNAGLMFDADPAQIDEDRLRDALAGTVSPAEIAMALAEAKALAVARSHPGAVVIGSDQILSAGEAILAKPGSRAGARETLKLLRGKSHGLHSGAALVRDDRVMWRSVESASLTMRNFSDAELEDYLDAAGDGIFGCVGAYQIEGLGIRLFERVEGDHFTIMGMPLLPLLSELRRHGVTA